MEGRNHLFWLDKILSYLMDEIEILVVNIITDEIGKLMIVFWEMSDPLLKNFKFLPVKNSGG
jgi:hypothetical protein